jgi:hypothetical protein
VARAGKVYSFIKEAEKKNSISEAKVCSHSGNASFRLFRKSRGDIKNFECSQYLLVECRAQQQLRQCLESIRDICVNILLHRRVRLEVLQNSNRDLVDVNDACS